MYTVFHLFIKEITQYLFVHSVKSILHVDKCIT